MKGMQKTLLVLAVIVIVVGVAFFVFRPTTTEEEFVVYVPAYFLYGNTEGDKNASYSYIFYQWGERHGVKVVVKEFDSISTMIDTINLEVSSGKPTASIAILTLDAFKKSNYTQLFERYVPQSKDVIDEKILEAANTSWYATPFEWIPLVFVYDSNYVKLTNVSFDSFLENETLANALMFVDPTVTEPGPQWLLSLIAYYRLKGMDNWTDWVTFMKDKMDVKGTWYDAWLYLISENKTRYIMTGYLSDAPLTNLWYGVQNYKYQPVYYNGSYYAWYEIGVIAIIKDNPHMELSKEFVEWFLSEPVQRWLPLYNGFLPANMYVYDEVPIGFSKHGIAFENIKPLNVLISDEEIKANLASWIEEWSNALS